MTVYLARDIPPFVMYCVNGKPRSSLLIESTDSMIDVMTTQTIGYVSIISMPKLKKRSPSSMLCVDITFINLCGLLLGKRLSVRPETGNNHDKYAVSVVKHGGIVGNFPRELLRTVWHFILHGGHVTCEVTGKRELGNGLEVAQIHRKMFFAFREIFLLVWNKLLLLSK